VKRRIIVAAAVWLEASQRRWLAARHRCGFDFACLKEIYIKRMDDLTTDAPPNF
jgi:uncharacterized protein